MFKERKIIQQPFELLAEDSKNLPCDQDISNHSKAMVEIYRELFKPITMLLFSSLAFVGIPVTLYFIKAC